MLGWLILFLMIWIPFKLVVGSIKAYRKRRYLNWYKKVIARRNELYLEGMWITDAWRVAEKEFAGSEPPWVICDTSKLDAVPDRPWPTKDSQ